MDPECRIILHALSFAGDISFLFDNTCLVDMWTLVFIVFPVLSEENSMKNFLKITAYLGLGLTLIPSLLVWSEVIDLPSNKVLMFIGTIVWFGCAPFAFKKKVS